MQRAQQAGDYAKASELQYGRLPQIERQIREEEGRLAELQKGQRMLKEEVDEEDIAEVVSRWTHIPVSRLMEGEIQKLLRMEERLHARVVGQDEAIGAPTPCAAPLGFGIKPSAGSFIFSAPRASARRTRPRARGVPVRRRAGDGPDRHVGYQEKHTVSRLIGAPPDMSATRGPGSSLSRAAAVRWCSSMRSKANPSPQRHAATAGRRPAHRRKGGRWTSEHRRDRRRMSGVISSPRRRPTRCRAPEVITSWTRGEAGPRLLREHPTGVLNRWTRSSCSARCPRRDAAHHRHPASRPEKPRDRKIRVELTDRAKDRLIAKCDQPARPLKRVIQRRVLDPLAMRVLQGEFGEGSAVRIDAPRGELEFTKAEDAVHA